VLGVAVEEGEVDAELLLEGAGGLHLPGGIVDADGAGAAPGEPGGDVAGAATELDRVAPVDRRRQQADFGLGDGEDPPDRFFALPVAAPRGDILGRQPVPEGAVGRDVLGQVRYPMNLARRRIGDRDGLALPTSRRRQLA
jgi:hypothetical protein